MRLSTSLFFLSVATFVTFTLFSYTVAKEVWQQLDFDTTVKLQDHISRRWDLFFSYFSMLGSAEVTILITLLFSGLSLLKLRWGAVVGWLMIVPASFIEIFGKLFVFHPGPPFFLHRTITPAQLPSFYIHTNFSFPSGHTTRTIFLITVLLVLLFFSKKRALWKFAGAVFLLAVAFMMVLTRIYLGEHWLSDVLGGGLLGLSTAFFACALMTIGKKLA